MENRPNWKNILLGAIVGAGISGIIFYMGYNSQLNVAEATQDTSMLSLLMLAGFFAGGLIASFIAKADKNNFSECISSAFIAGTIDALLFLILLQLQMPMETMLSELAPYVGTEYFLPNLFFVFLIFIVLPLLFIFLSTLGGLVGAYLTNSRSSYALESFKKEIKGMWWGWLVLPILLLMVASAVQNIVLDVQEDLMFGLAIFSILFLATMISLAVSSLLTQKKTFSEMLKHGISKLPRVFITLLILLYLLPSISMLLLTLTGFPLMWSLIIIDIYFLFASFAPVIAFREKKYLPIKESFDFVKNNFLHVLALYAILFLIISVLLGAIFLAGILIEIEMIVFEILINIGLGLVIAVVITSQNQLVKGEKK